MQEFLVRTSNKPRPLPSGRWAISQRWNDLLYAHWPVPPSAVAALLPDGVLVDTFNGSAWVGVAPFQMERLKLRGFPRISGPLSYPELSLRTYVHEQRTATPGVYFFSLDIGSLLASTFARALFQLPCHWAEMRFQPRAEKEFEFYSRRLFSRDQVVFQARYRGLGPSRRLLENSSGTLEHFLTERHCLFTRNRAGLPIRANMHSVAGPMEEAEAEIERNDLAAAIGLQLPNQPPVLHYLRRMAVYIWPSEVVRPALAARQISIAVTPSG